MKKNLLIACLAFTLSAAIAQVPNFSWVKTTVTLNDPEVGIVGGTVVDTINGYVYATGSFDGGGIDFGNGIIESASGAQAPYLAKYNLGGSLIWAKAFKADHDNIATGVGVDNAGNIYVTGYSQDDTTSFGNMYILNSHPNSTDHTVGYVVKFDSNGNPQWIKGSTGGGGVIANAITVDAAGNSYFTGHVYDATGNFMGTAVTEGAFFAKLSTTGTLSWFKQTSPGGPLISQGTAIALDKAGNCLVSGTHSYAMNFGSIAVSYSGGAGTWDRFVTKLDGGTGSFIWATGSGNSAGPDYAYDVATDGQNNVYVNGFVTVSAPNGNSANNFIEKFNPAGASQWMHTFEKSLYSPVTSLATDKQGNVYSLFNISDTTTFGTFTVNTTSPLFANSTIVTAIVKFDGAGNVLYAKATGDPVILSWSQANSCAVDASGNLYINTTISNECKFDGIDLQPGSHNEFALAKLGNAGGNGGTGGGTVGIPAQNTSQNTRVYPNPASNAIYISALTEKANITLTDISGKIVLETQAPAGAVKLDISALSGGAYLLEIRSGAGVSHQKIIVNTN